MVHFFKLLGTKSFVTILAFFLEHPSSEIHAAELQRKTKLAKKSVLDSLKKLCSAKSLNGNPRGRTIFYSLSRENPVVKELKRLLTVAFLLELLGKAGIEGINVFVYGSAARGENTETSDIDLLIVGDYEKQKQLNKLLKDSQIKIVFFTPFEYAELARKDKPFYESIERSKIKLI